jgi:hypothetical protein
MGLFRRAELHLLLFFVILLVFSRPFFIEDRPGLHEAVYTYLFVTWALSILLLFMISRSLAVHTPDEEKNGRLEP